MGPIGRTLERVIAACPDEQVVKREDGTVDDLASAKKNLAAALVGDVVKAVTPDKTLTACLVSFLLGGGAHLAQAVMIGVAADIADVPLTPAKIVKDGVDAGLHAAMAGVKALGI